MGKGALIGFFLYLIVGLLLINFSFNFINIGFISSIENWIILAGGILVLAGGINYLRKSRLPY